MLKTRLITAVVIAALALVLLFATEATVFVFITGLIVLGIGGWEAGRLSGLDAWRGSLLYAAALSLAGFGLAAAAGIIAPEIILFDQLHVLQSGVSVPVLLLAPAVLWIVLFGWLLQPALGKEASPGWQITKLAVLATILIGAWLALCWLHQRSPWLVFMLIVIIAAADIGAYFTGRTVGGRKLAPRISPGKTWSGLIGGVVATVVITAGSTFVVSAPPFAPLLAGAIAFILAWISVGGDLFMSMLKRQRGIKDSSRLLPGHGGLLDRLDSLGAALPFFALAVAYLAGQ